MGPMAVAEEMGLEMKLCAMRTVGGFLKEASAIECGDGGRAARLEESIRSLEEEKRKIEAFKRELPLCMHLLGEVIEGLNKEIERCRCERFGRAFEEFVPVKSKVEDDGGIKEETEYKDKRNWMSSAKLWNDNCSQNNNDSKKHDKIKFKEKDGDSHRRQGKENFFSERKSRNGGGAFVPFRGLPPFADSCKREEEKPAAALPDLSLQSPAIRNHHVSGCASRAVGNAPEMTPATVGAHVSLQSLQQQPPRKARRCWSQELHRRFMRAIQQLGGVQVATPKQIRDRMKVDGLTNDEVKSHLQVYRLLVDLSFHGLLNVLALLFQKYRLHTRRMSNASAIPQDQHTCSSQQSVSQSNSPQSPLQLAGSALALSVTAGESLEDDGKSESYSWK
ncbi:transcription factor HHO5-like isoform X1 [Musa acuminata AAA Group]|uniref:transcription factor HHO5-like isoform X1 n=1 Tax=Musa acuminata AAA Group TaxID=214697 RepID=UPI0031E1A202